MNWQSIAPIEGAATVSGVLRYSAGQQGYAGRGGGQSREERAKNPQKGQKDKTDGFISSNAEKPSEYQLLMTKMMEDSEQMRKTAKYPNHISQGARPAVLITYDPESGLLASEA